MARKLKAKSNIVATKTNKFVTQKASPEDAARTPTAVEILTWEATGFRRRAVEQVLVAREALERFEAAGYPSDAVRSLIGALLFAHQDLAKAESLEMAIERLEVAQGP